MREEIRLATIADPNTDVLGGATRLTPTKRLRSPINTYICDKKYKNSLWSKEFKLSRLNNKSVAGVNSGSYGNDGPRLPHRAQ